MGARNDTAFRPRIPRSMGYTACRPTRQKRHRGPEGYPPYCEEFLGRKRVVARAMISERRHPQNSF